MRECGWRLVGLPGSRELGLVGGRRQVSCPGSKGGQRQTGLLPGESDYQGQKRTGQGSRETRAETGQEQAGLGLGGQAGKHWNVLHAE